MLGVVRNAGLAARGPAAAPRAHGQLSAPSLPRLSWPAGKWAGPPAPSADATGGGLTATGQPEAEAEL